MGGQTQGRSTLLRCLATRKGCRLSRNPVHVRDVLPDDVPFLLTIWTDVSRRVHPERGHCERSSAPSPEAECADAVARVSADPDQRILVGLYDGRVVGAAHLARAPISPISTETAIHLSHLNVVEGYRRRGVGRALMEAAVTWAEETGIHYMMAAAHVASRDANRFMARLGLLQVAALRGAAVCALRAKLPVEPPAAARVGTRSARGVGQVLAARRSMRRAQAKPL